MQAKLLGVKRLKGESKKDGKAYDICNLFIIVPVEQVTSEKFNALGAGFEIAEMPLLPEHFDGFQKLSYPIDVNLRLETQTRYGKFESVCVGFVPVAKQSNG